MPGLIQNSRLLELLPVSLSGRLQLKDLGLQVPNLLLQGDLLLQRLDKSGGRGESRISSAVHVSEQAAGSGAPWCDVCMLQPHALRG